MKIYDILFISGCGDKPILLARGLEGLEERGDSVVAVRPWAQKTKRAEDGVPGRTS